MPELFDILYITYNISASVSALACLYMFYRYCRLPHKNFGAKMIVTLSVADSLYLFAFLLVSAFSDDIPEEFQDYLINFPFGFSIFWSFVISFFLYRLISQSKHALQPSRYYNRSFIVVLLLCFITTAILYIYKQFDQVDGQDEALKKLLGIIFYALYWISMFLTSFYFKKSIRILKENDCFSSQATQQFIKTLSRYSLVQFLTIGPYFLYSGLSFIFPIQSDVVTAIAMIFAGLAGFGNCVVYFFTRDGFAASAESSMKNNDITASESFYEDHDFERQLRIQAYT